MLNNKKMRSSFVKPSRLSFLGLQGNKQKVLLLQKKETPKCLTPNIKSLNEKISEILTSEFEDNFNLILKLTETQFLSTISQNAFQFLIDINKGYEISTESGKEAFKSNENNIKSKYLNCYKILSQALDAYKKDPSKFKILKNFRKHCWFTEDIAIHSCNNKTSKFIQVYTKNEKQISYVICLECLDCFTAKSILLYCSNCQCEYYSNVLGPNEDSNILPATWDKYHCGYLVNETMKCVKCKDILYLNFNTMMLVCLNSKCGFSSKPNSIIWKCSICKKDFTSDAKVYNPKEIQMIKKAIKITLLLRKQAYPQELPCCQEDPKKLKFYHKKECEGILFQGTFKGKDIVVCEICHAMNFHEKFLWTCPICKNRFRANQNEYEYVDGNKRNSSRGFFIDSSDNENCKSSDGIFNENSAQSKIRAYSQQTYRENEEYEQTISRENTEQTTNDISKNELKGIRKRGRYSTLLDILNERNRNNAMRFTLSLHLKKNQNSEEKSKRHSISNAVCNISLPKPNEDYEEVKRCLRNSNNKKGKSLFIKIEEPYSQTEYGDNESFRMNEKDKDDESKNDENKQRPKIIQKDASKKNKKILKIIDTDISLNKNPSLKKENSERNEQQKEKDKEKKEVKFNIIEKPKIETNFQEPYAPYDLVTPKIQQTKELIKQIIISSKIPIININEYKIKTSIGVGSFGKIYLTEKIKTQEKFALKKIIINNPFEIVRFKNEFELVYTFQEINIVKIYGIQYKFLDLLTYSIYVLMELANSDWNAEINKREKNNMKYQEKELFSILKQLVEVMAFLQKNNISHRDIKPQNILLFNNGIFKISDFGEAKKTKAGGDFNTLKGTELFMSPILYDGLRMNKKDIVHNVYKSDVFSLGFCFLFAANLNYQIVNKIREFKEMNQIEKYVRNKLKESYSNVLIDTLLKMLEVDENKRLDFIELDLLLKEINY